MKRERERERERDLTGGICVGWSAKCSAALAHVVLKERLHTLGIVGCVLCIVGSTTIVLHAPKEQTIDSVEKVWGLATEPGVWSPPLQNPPFSLSRGCLLYRVLWVQATEHAQMYGCMYLRPWRNLPDTCAIHHLMFDPR
jgi:hypothetical protein